jgi:hypothetical protein
MKVNWAYAALILACGIALGPRPAARAGAQAGVPRVVEIDKVTCAASPAAPLLSVFGRAA